MKKTIFVVALSVAGFIAVWRFEPTAMGTTTTGPPAASAPSSPSTSAGRVGTSVTVPGSAEGSEFGTVQVQVSFSGSRITDVQLLQQPQSGRGVGALPRLREEALQAQSANIDTVSGATQTSESYIRSLQAALDAKGS
ncbi:FMN-binding protein [Amycolatopsis sp. PS_44_ISF1]|uniref:FMN-binding protein n=1 Tax=Amycolatopsis sp. PS_44_ISF1 TaxID=2974917 RepID=UPI0028DEA8B4|nr:FMN-binding protein [Amycolatopsis sp. PS_44_ISF1]MDT8915634.1 FMN-binding protein [Amycolatopsis sp. PS_44_ISF1]